MQRKTLRDAFLTGLIVVGPLAITLLAVTVVYNWLVSLTSPVLSVIPGPTNPLAEFISVVLVITGILVIGLLAMRGDGYQVMVHLDNVMERIPVVNVLYSGIRRASQVLATTHESQLERVVLVEWPRENTYTIGFITSQTPDSIGKHVACLDDEGGEEKVYNVLIPLSPNPMSGFFAIVPESNLVVTDLSIQAGIQMAVTTGLSAQDDSGSGELPIETSEESGGDGRLDAVRPKLASGEEDETAGEAES